MTKQKEEEEILVDQEDKKDNKVVDSYVNKHIKVLDEDDGYHD